jgi:hypothetical protein
LSRSSRIFPETAIAQAQTTPMTSAITPIQLAQRNTSSADIRDSVFLIPISFTAVALRSCIFHFDLFVDPKNRPNIRELPSRSGYGGLAEGVIRPFSASEWRIALHLSACEFRLDDFDIGQPINYRRCALKGDARPLKITRTARFKKPAEHAARVCGQGISHECAFSPGFGSA